jgi:cytochrome P450
VVADIKKSIEESDDASCGDTTTMFLSSLMKSRISDDSSVFNSRNHLSDTEIAAQIKTFLIAGTETTAVTIASAVQYLSDPKYSDLANALYMETKNCFLGERYPSSLDQLRNMPLVSAFLKESMRLHGPAPLSFNELAESQKSTIISGGYTVYKTVSVGIKIHYI